MLVPKWYIWRMQCQKCHSDTQWQLSRQVRIQHGTEQLPQKTGYSAGADPVIDYTQEDFTKSGETWDVIFDVAGKSSFSGSVRSLKQSGRYLLVRAGLSQMVRGRWTSMTSSKKVIFGAASY